MRLTIGAVLLSACSVMSFAQTASTSTAPAAHPKSAKAKTRKKTAAPSHAITAETIPAGAVKTPEGSYRYTDSAGKAWIYRETPFGVSRVAADARPAAANGSVQTPFGVTKTETAAPKPATAVKADATEHITAVAKGDNIQFQKPTPFGMTSWLKNKSNLTPEEQQIWAREQAKGTH